MPSNSESERDRKRVRFDSNHDKLQNDSDDVLTDTTKRCTALPAKEVVQLRFVHAKSDVSAHGAAGPHASELTSQPKFLNQIIEDELVYGYKKGSIVAIYVHLPSLTYWFDSSLELLALNSNEHEGKVNDSEEPDKKSIPLEDEEEDDDDGAMEVTDVEELLTPLIKSGLTLNRPQFLFAIHNFNLSSNNVFPMPSSSGSNNNSNHPMPLKNCVMKYANKNDGNSYGIYKESLWVLDKSSGTMVKQERFHDFHRRMAFLMFIQIDGASFIDDDDTRWEVFVVAKLENDIPVSFVGYATTYPFSVLNPNRNTPNSDSTATFVDRIRISQVAIVPIYHRQGHGAKLVQAIYEVAHARKAIEITVEDPSLGFRMLRDVMDLQWAYRKEILPSQESVSSTLMFNDEKAVQEEQKLKTELRSKLLITYTQARRCLEVHQLRFIDRDDEVSYKAYRLWVKRRLYKEYEDVLEHCGDASERKERLAQLYDDIEKEYLASSRRVSRSIDDNTPK